MIRLVFSVSYGFPFATRSYLKWLQAKNHRSTLDLWLISERIDANNSQVWTFSQKISLVQWIEFVTMYESWEAKKRLYIQIWRSICTSKSLRAFIRVSSDFILFRHSSSFINTVNIFTSKYNMKRLRHIFRISIIMFLLKFIRKLSDRSMMRF